MSWLFYAFVSAAAAAVTAILAKIGVEGVPSTLATAVRTVVVLLFSWALVFALGEHRGLATVSRRSLMFLLLSGVFTGVSWLAHFRAFQLGPPPRGAPLSNVSPPPPAFAGMRPAADAMTRRLAVGG